VQIDRGRLSSCGISEIIGAAQWEQKFISLFCELRGLAVFFAMTVTYSIFQQRSFFIVLFASSSGNRFFERILPTQFPGAIRLSTTTLAFSLHM
jgi:hypothetical protein